MSLCTADLMVFGERGGYTLSYAHPETRINKKNDQKLKMSQKKKKKKKKGSLDYGSRQRMNQPSSHPQDKPSPSVNLSTPRHPLPFSLSSLQSLFSANPDTRAVIFTQVSHSLSFTLFLFFFVPPGRAPSDEGQDAVDEQGHDGSAEQAGHGHRDKPRQEDVPEEAPVHCFLGADPTDSHDWADLEGRRPGRGEGTQSEAAQNRSSKEAKPMWGAAGCSGFSYNWENSYIQPP